VVNRFFASLAIVSLLVALIVSVLWWRADHGHSDTFHLGAQSATQTVFTTLPGARVAVSVENHDPALVHGNTRFYPLRSVMGGAFVVPSLWAAIWLRRRIRPRPPGVQLPAMRNL